MSPPAIIVPAGLAGGPYQIVGATAASEGTVLFDTKANTGVVTGTGTSVTAQCAITPGSGANGSTNLALILGVYFMNGINSTSNPSASVHGGAALTAIGSNTGHSASAVYLFGLTNPGTSSISFDVSWTGTNGIILTAFTVVGADQTGGATTFISTLNNGNSTSASTGSLTSPSNRICFAGFCDGGGSGFTTTGNTDVVHLNTGSVSSMAACYDVHGTNPTLSYSLASNPWNAVGISIKGA